MDLNYKESIISYYDNTRLDYRILWYRNNHNSVHFGFYDDEVTTHKEALLNLNKVMAKKAGVRDGDVILDAGCGRGGSSIWLAENFNVKVEGITLVPHQVQKAKKLASKKQLQSRVGFSEQDYCNTEFKDESFSLIWACESMCHAQDKKKFYQEAYRLLKPGGRLVCADYIRTDRPLSEDGEALLHSWLGGWSIKDIDTYDEHEQNVQSAGFADFTLEDITKFTEPSLSHLHSMSNKLWGFGTFLRKIGLRNDVNHGNHLASIRQYEALQNKLWYYGLMVLIKE
ncbi:SAM-dependent methyltransferase [Lutimonas sp.]|uniref:SAM-dependent methyltransferase n=1 Tax=Lutimonas sp. TaxID=1872403 RepID=UPI003D9B72E1